MNKISKLIRLAEVHADNIDPKLYMAKSAQTIKNYIYKITDKYTRGLFRDDDWSNAHKVFNIIAQAGFDINWGAKGGGYTDMDRKTYQFEIDFENINGKKFHFKGQLICSFAGSVDNPMEKYDMIFQIF